ncbi:MAG: hypothetical protein DI586_09125 [Micavibrio aeruginosavorus]|uniref:Uncharacterized protein n=1 Tax=Micavibrio aeruginosavorus TaxID=349221 RepID=A0A2W5FJX0_9BACT|nr:MAG: hypothetical protein DI586_09125 [Micavibrio aeruginosavorus]
MQRKAARASVSVVPRQGQGIMPFYADKQGDPSRNRMIMVLICLWISVVVDIGLGFTYKTPIPAKTRKRR